jgi:hypothetical protein
MKNAIEHARPELVKSIQGRQELDRMTLEIMTALRQAGLHVVTARQKEPCKTDLPELGVRGASEKRQPDRDRQCRGWRSYGSGLAGSRDDANRLTGFVCAAHQDKIARVPLQIGPPRISVQYFCSQRDRVENHG